MIIEKMKIINFKKFYGEKDIIFNEDFNVIIGNNESGKSSILLALDLVLSGSQSKIETIGLENLFNCKIIDEFMNGDKDVTKLPKLIIELYLKDTGIIEFSGNNNQEKREADGICLKISPDEDFIKIISESLSKENCVFPFEYYKCTFKKFSDESYNNYKKPIRHIIIDGSNISSEYYMKDYISSLYSAYADSTLKNLYNNEFRKLKKDFETNSLSSFNDKVPNVNFGLSTHNKYSLENNLTIYEQGVNIWNKGSGTQCMLKIKSSIEKQSENIDLILIEEPENHLSDINMKKILKDIMNSNKKQMSVTTHNSMICSRLNLKKIIALNETNISTTEFNSISDDTANFFVKCPSNTILNFILSSKVILVEGAAEYILLQKLYELYTNNNPIVDNINIISVNGLSFERYLEIAQSLKIKVAVITDNDEDYENKIINKYSKYDSNDNINVFSDTDNSRYTFEVCLFKDNQEYINNNNITQASDKLKFMLNNKSESAYRLLETLEENTNNFKIAKYIEDAFKWIKN